MRAKRPFQLLPLPADHVQLFRRNILAPQIAAVVGKPQLARGRVEIEAHGIAHAAGIHLGGYSLIRLRVITGLTQGDEIQLALINATL